MKKNKFKILLVLLTISMIILVSACGSGSKDELAGTWIGSDPDFGEVSWTFDGKGECSFENDFTDQKGTYDLADDSTVTIDLELWDQAKVYSYQTGDKTLTLEATDPFSPSYDLNKK